MPAMPGVCRSRVLRVYARAVLKCAFIWTLAGSGQNAFGTSTAQSGGSARTIITSKIPGHYRQASVALPARGAGIGSQGSGARRYATIRMALADSVVDRFEPTTVTISTDAMFVNPHDPDDICVDALIRYADGGVMVQPCFFKTGESGESLWEGRFAARFGGICSVYVRIAFPSDTIRSVPAGIRVRESGRDGFLHRDTGSPYLLRFDSGRRFRGVGHNFGWESSSLTYESICGLLQASHCTMVRTWMCPWNLALEWTTAGPVRYNEQAAQRLDEALGAARAKGLYVILVLDYHGAFLSLPDYWGGNNFWPQNPYNSANGGMCAAPGDFFTREDALQAYCKRLRYLIARWGANPALAAIEFINEVDNVSEAEDIGIDTIVQWHRQVGAWFRQHDPYGHILTTSVSHATYDSLWRLPQLDLVQMHLYGPTDNFISRINASAARYGKPFVIGEFARYWEGPSSRGTRDEYTLELHRGLWRGLFARTPILPLSWWWDWHASWDDWNHFNAAALFNEQIVLAADSLSDSIAVQASGYGVTCAGLQCPGRRFIWVETAATSPVQRSEVQLAETGRGPFELVTFDTYSGQQVGSTLQIWPESGFLRFETPTLQASDDFAFIITDPSALMAQPIARHPSCPTVTVRRVRSAMYVDLSGPVSQPVDITIRDMRGRQVVARQRLSMTGGKARVALSALPLGAYIAELSSESFRVHSLFIL